MLVQGLSQRLAYRQAFDNRKSVNERIDERASRLRNSLHVCARLQAILKAAKLTDLDSAGAAIADMLSDLSRTRAAENWTAAAAFTKIRRQPHGLMRDNLTVTMEQLMTDDDLAKRLAKGDEAKAAALRAVLGNASFDEPLETKH